MTLCSLPIFVDDGRGSVPGSSVHRFNYFAYVQFDLWVFHFPNSLKLVCIPIDHITGTCIVDKICSDTEVH